MSDSDSHWGCTVCPAGTNTAVPYKRARNESSNHSFNTGHFTVYGATEAAA